MRFKIGRPSPALVIACISLFIALGGVGYAAATGSIDGREIKNNSVASKDVKNSSLSGGDVKNSGLKGADVAANSLTGADIAESGLGKVPSAGQADNAATAGSATSANSADTAGSVGGLTLRKVNFQTEENVADAPIASLGGLTLRASCTASSVTITGRTSVADSTILNEVTDTDDDTTQSNDLESGGFDVATTFDFLDGDDGNPNMVSFAYSNPNGNAVTGQLVVDESAPDCQVVGTLVGG